MESERGSPIVEIEGYLMMREKLSPNGTRYYWRCTHRYKGCHGRAISEVGSDVVRHTKGHNHLPSATSPQ
ncbi:hypothetical protein AAVH_11318, partial [Aphelenchoides avenae]